MTRSVRERDPVANRPFRCPLKPCVDREPQPGQRVRPTDEVERPDRAPQGIDAHACTLQASVEDPVVGRLDARLSDELAGPGAAVRSLAQLGRTHFAEQAEELAPERALRIA